MSDFKIVLIAIGIEAANDSPYTAPPDTPSNPSVAPCLDWAACEAQACFDFGCQTVLHKDCPPSCPACRVTPQHGRTLQ